MTHPALEVIEGGQGTERRQALRELYSKYGGTVFGRCQYLLKDPTAAEDAMQDVFAKAFTSWTEFRSDASPLTWLGKIATNHCLNVLRADKAPWRSQFERDERARPEGHGGPQVAEVRDEVRKLLGRFDVETQAAAIHYHVDEMTLEEVAALLKRSVPTIRKRLQAFATATGQDFAP